MSTQPSFGARAGFAAGLGLSLLALAGCRQDMHNQPKFYPQRGSEFYADGRSVRPQVGATVAREQLRSNSYFYTGFQNGKEGEGMPFPVTETVLRRGQTSYNVYCTPCHSRVGNGAGMIVSRGYAAAGNFHTERLEKAPLGHFFNVITNGYGAMPDYSSQLTEQDRWAVVAYIRALQLSQRASKNDLPADAHPQPLDEITEQQGFRPGFAYDWGLPPTAVKGTTSGENYVISPDINNPPDTRGGPGMKPSEQGNTQTVPNGPTTFPEDDAHSVQGAMNEQK